MNFGLCLDILQQEQYNLNIGPMQRNADFNVNEYLRDLIQNKQNITEISLQFKSISDLLPYLHHFQRLPKLKKLSLHGNRIKQLPTNLMDIFPSLEDLDITNNLLDDNTQMTILSLKTIPRLKRLSYHIKKDKEKRLGEQLKSLQFLNNTRIIRKKHEKEFQFKHANEKSLYEFQQKIVQKFSFLLQFQQKYVGEIMQPEAIDKFRKQIKQISNECLQKLNANRGSATESLQNIMLYTTKYEVYELVKIRTLNLCMDIYSDLGKFMKSIFDEEEKLFKLIAEMTLALARNQIFEREKENQAMQDNQFQSQHSIVNKNAIMQKELKRMRKQKDELVGQINNLQNQNKKLTEALYKLSKNDGMNPKNMPIIQSFPQTNTQPPKDLAKSRTQVNESSKNIDKFKGNPQKMKNLSTKEINPTYNNYNYTSTKSLSLKQLKEIIQQIYQSKVKFDQKNYNGKLARQTMNQHLFTYLNQKYGLKTLTIEAASNIVSGIQQFSNKDNDIAVFGKILRNQIDQQFRFVQSELKSTITDLLKMHIKTKMPYKSTYETNEMMSKKINGQITFEECQDLIRYLYNKADSNQILVKIEPVFLEKQKAENVQGRRRAHNEPTNASVGRGKMLFSAFLQHVLNFQLKNHERLLKPLVNSFKLKDSDSDGIVDQQQFISIIELLCEDASSLIPSLLDIIDPYETKAITFTQMVRLVANYPQNNPILNRHAQNNTETHEYEYNS